MKDMIKKTKVLCKENNILLTVSEQCEMYEIPSHIIISMVTIGI